MCRARAKGRERERKKERERIRSLVAELLLLLFCVEEEVDFL